MELGRPKLFESGEETTMDSNSCYGFGSYSDTFLPPNDVDDANSIAAFDLTLFDPYRIPTLEEHVKRATKTFSHVAMRCNGVRLTIQCLKLSNDDE